MKLDAQNIGKQGMLDRFDDFSVQRSGGHAQIGAQLADGLVVGRGHEGPVVLENPSLRTKTLSLPRRMRWNGYISSLSFGIELFQVDARMDLVGTGCQDLFHRLLTVHFGRDILDQGAAGGHVQALDAEADGQDGKIPAARPGTG